MPDEFGLSNEFIAQYRKSSMIESATAFDAVRSTLRTDDRVERVLMCFHTRSLFDTLDARPILGRLPLREKTKAVLLSSVLDNLVRERSENHRPILRSEGGTVDRSSA